MRRLYKNVCPATINASIIAANMWKNSLKNVQSDKNKILYETLLDFFLQRNGTYFMNKRRILLQVYIDMMCVVVIIGFLTLHRLVGTNFLKIWRKLFSSTLFVAADLSQTQNRDTNLVLSTQFNFITEFFRLQ